MRSYLQITVLCVLAAAAATVRASDRDPSEQLPGVAEMTSANIAEIMGGGKGVFVQFYAPWCGHCKTMVPEMEFLGELMEIDHKVSSRITVAKSNVVKWKSIGEQFGVDGFPKLLFFPQGVGSGGIVHYQDKKAALSIMAFLRMQMEETKPEVLVVELGGILDEWITTSDRKPLLQRAKDVSTRLTGDARENAEVFISLMTKAVEGGDGYLRRELKQLEKMIATRKAPKGTTLAQLQRKLAAFDTLLQAPDNTP